MARKTTSETNVKGCPIPMLRRYRIYTAKKIVEYVRGINPECYDSDASRPSLYPNQNYPREIGHFDLLSKTASTPSPKCTKKYAIRMPVQGLNRISSLYTPFGALAFGDNSHT